MPPTVEPGVSVWDRAVGTPNAVSPELAVKVTNGTWTTVTDAVPVSAIAAVTVTPTSALTAKPLLVIVTVVELMRSLVGFRASTLDGVALETFPS